MKKEITEATPESIFSSGSCKDLLPYDLPGGRLYIKKISNIVCKQWSLANRDSEDDLYNDASLIQICTCKKDGSPFFTPEQVPRIASMDEDQVLPLAKACGDYNGLSKESASNIAKNSEKIPVSDS